MRSTIVTGLVLLANGCAAIRGLDDYSIAGASVGTGDDAAMHATSGEGGAGCTTHDECDGTAVCVKATGRCVQLTTLACPRVLGDPRADGAVLVGTLLGTESEHASLLAAGELASGPASLPHLVLVGCDVGTDALVPARHLAEELHVSAILGPQRAEDVVAVTQVSARSGTLLVTDSPVGSIANLADEDLTWRVVSSDTQRAKLVIEQMNELETLLRATRSLATVKLAIAHTSDSLGTSARDAITGKLILNGHFLLDAANAGYVRDDQVAPGDAAGYAALVTAYARQFRPDMVFVTAAEQITSLVVPLEQSLAAARVVDRPYYVLTDVARTADLLARIDSGELPADIRRRIRGVGPVAPVASATVLADFETAFAARYGTAPASATNAMYDATYALAYASGTGAGTIGHGLRALAVGPQTFVGPKAMNGAAGLLAKSQPLQLVGTQGPLQWDASGDLRGGTIEVWCIGSRNGAAAFGSSGMTMDVQTQVVGGAYVQCQ